MRYGRGTAGAVWTQEFAVFGRRVNAHWWVRGGEERGEEAGWGGSGGWVSGRRTMVNDYFAGLCHWTGTLQETRLHRCCRWKTCRVREFTRSCSGELTSCRPSADNKGKSCCHQTFHLYALISCGQMTHGRFRGLLQLVLLPREHSDAAVQRASPPRTCGRDAPAVVWRCGATNRHQLGINRCRHCQFNGAAVRLKR